MICPADLVDVIAPNGRAVTDNFKAWFQSSKVVGADGKPQVVFHGTAKDFHSFDAEKAGRNYISTGGQRGFFFTDNPGTASVYAEKPAFAYLNPNGDPKHARFGDGTANIMPVYLSLQQPIEITTKQSPDKYFDYNRDKIYERAQKAGADGVIVKGVGEHPRTLYIAFDARQIKSAIGNSGVYDRESSALHDLVAESNEPGATQVVASGPSRRPRPR